MNTQQLTSVVKDIISEHYAIPIDVVIFGSKGRPGKGGTLDRPFVACARKPAEGWNDIAVAPGRSATEALVYLVYEATRTKNPEVAEVEECHKKLTALGVVRFGLEEEGLRTYSLSHRLLRLRVRLGGIYERGKAGIARPGDGGPALGDVVMELGKMLHGKTI